MLMLLDSLELTRTRVTHLKRILKTLKIQRPFTIIQKEEFCIQLSHMYSKLYNYIIILYAKLVFMTTL